ncbi:MAG: DUF4013 domain-containing protein [Methanobrevibacter sp.]|nr:DUF4013 domain-containing protein [Methanobrevibacter sp.]
MNVTGLFKDSFTYPLRDSNKLLFLGAVFIVGGLLTILPVFISGVLGINIALNQQFLLAIITFIVMGIILFLTSAIISGYGISVIRKTLFNPDKVPSFDLVKNLVSGLKLAILSVVYYLIPVAISLLLSYFVNFSIGFIVWILLSTIATLLLIVATSRLAETNSLKEALKIDEVFKDISKIGIANYIVWIIIYLSIGIIISFITFIIMFIPIIGVIIGFLAIMPFITMFSARAIGLLYNESKLILNH